MKTEHCEWGSRGFIKIQKDLFYAPKYKGISAEAKMLYGFLCDRRQLSEKNKTDWTDENGEVYIYFPLTEVEFLFGCGHDKAGSLLRELEAAPLVKRKRQGLGKPCRVFVKTAEQNAQKHKTRELENSGQACGESASNKKDSTKIERKKTLYCERDEVEKEICKNINFDVLAQETNKEQLEGIVHLIAECICAKESTVKIAGEAKLQEDVERMFRGLNDMHIRYVLDRIKREEKRILNPKAYILARLYEAENVMDVFYQSWADTDLRR